MNKDMEANHEPEIHEAKEADRTTDKIEDKEDEMQADVPHSLALCDMPEDTLMKILSYLSYKDLRR